jgi:hypothetical protein
MRRRGRYSTNHVLQLYRLYLPAQFFTLSAHLGRGSASIRCVTIGPLNPALFLSVPRYGPTWTRHRRDAETVISSRMRERRDSKPGWKR